MLIAIYPIRYDSVVILGVVSQVQHQQQLEASDEILSNWRRLREKGASSGTACAPTTHE